MRETVHRLAILILLLLSLGLTILSICTRQTREQDRTLMRIGSEDVARYVREMRRAYEVQRKDEEAAILAKAKAFAELVALDPTLLTSASRLEEVRNKLALEELHVSDARGILIADIPATDTGFDMKAFPETAVFMPAITNRDFAFVQDVQIKPADGRRIHYAGVARLDQPGIIEVGSTTDQIEAMRQAADVKALESSLRIGAQGRLRIVSRAGLPPCPTDIRVYGANGEREYRLEADCGEWRICVTMPVAGLVLADDIPFAALVLLDVFLFCALLALVVPGLLKQLSRSSRTLQMLLASAERASGQPSAYERRIMRFIGHPVTILCAVIFIAALSATWVITGRYAERRTESILETNAAAIKSSTLSSIDDMLYFMGNAICRHYRKPSAMTQDSVNEVMSRYGIDELNVVDNRGIIIAGALADVGFDMGSKRESALFNCLLDGTTRLYCQPFRAAIEDPNIVRKYAGIAFPDAKGYIQVGFDRRRLKEDVDYRFKSSMACMHVGERGYFICANEETGEIIACGSPHFREGDTLASVGFDITRAPQSPDKTFYMRLYGEWCHCRVDTYAYHRILVVLPDGEMMSIRLMALGLAIAMLLVVFALVSFFMVRLSNLVDSLKSFIDADKERQQQDLSMARTIQTSSLPIVFPSERDYAIVARMDTAKEVGGDFYDFYTIPATGKVLFLIADVSGKGVPAAMFMMKAKAILRACVVMESSLPKAVADANDRLAKFNEAEMFVTAWIGLYDRATGEVEYVNAGHNPPLLKSADGSVTWLKERHGMALAAMEGMPYRSGRLTLAPNERIFLYTDGVTEAMNKAGELYGEPRLERTLAAAGADSLGTVRADIETFVAGAERSDDITILVLARREGAD